MRAHPGSWILVALTGALVAGGVSLHGAWQPPEEVSGEASAYAVLGAPKLGRAYAAWTRAHEAGAGERAVEVALTYSKGLSSAFTRAATPWP